MGSRITSAELSRMIRQSSLDDRGRVADAVAASELQFRRVDPDHFIPIFSRRAAGLPAKRSEHAKQLRRAINLLINTIQSLESPKIACAEVAAEPVGRYSIFIERKSKTLLGYLFTIGQHEVSPADWRRLWGRL